MTEVQTVFTLGDQVKWKQDPFGYYGELAGIVTKTDLPIAKTDELGWESHGVIEVTFPNGYIGQAHWSKFERVVRDRGDA